MADDAIKKLQEALKRQKRLTDAVRKAAQEIAEQREREQQESRAQPVE